MDDVRSVETGEANLSSFADNTHLENGWNKWIHLTLLIIRPVLTVSVNGEEFEFGKNKTRKSSINITGRG